MKNTFLALRDAAGTGALILAAGSLIFGGYILLNSMSDLRRYIRISTM